MAAAAGRTSARRATRNTVAFKTTAEFAEWFVREHKIIEGEWKWDRHTRGILENAAWERGKGLSCQSALESAVDEVIKAAKKH